jgi:hypothetical protein
MLVRISQILVNHTSTRYSPPAAAGWRAVVARHAHAKYKRVTVFSELPTL